MKYNELFELNKNFRPAYIINEEDISYWKLFIPNNPFNEILDCTLKSLTSSLTQEKKSIWVQGTFGTGKSHAGAVIKHLLWDDYENLRDYENVLKIELKEKLKNYRQNNRVFPIVLKGISGITNNKNLILVIEKAVKEALTKNGITVNVKSDFERWIEHVEKNDFLNWDKIISDNQILKMHVNNKDELLLKLKNNDIDILNNLENIISQQNIHFSTSNISNWLSDIADDLKNKGIASSLMIFWDEFTSILELNNAKTILNEIQNIAELLSPQGKVFLYIICHKMVEQAVPLEDVKRIQGRFYPHDYSMTTLTTYHIMSTYIKKKDIKLFESQLHEHINSNPQLLKLISDLANDNCENRMRDIKNLFPIHPYTGYIATYISRYIGSAQRSIFNFLHDSNKGFLKFINENPDTNNNIFLTADWMFDYFFEEFEKDGSEKINYILNHYLNVKNELENNENGYINVFKTIMLLNILHQEVYFGEDIKQLTPTTTNLKRIYLGTNLENQIDDILNFIDSKNFVSKTPDDRFVIHTIGLPNAPEDEEIKKEIEKKYENIVKILDYNPKAIEEFKSFFTTNILRESEINFYSASTNL
ncbi:MAG TPA: hypothetical protein PK771_08730, partial [Spirochaetota bacterium]|nr:hypothetical protein [Spirochaetota bacterium]